MLLVVTGVGFLIHVYSVGYMKHEEGYWRYFSYLNLFLFFMTVLVLAGNALYATTEEGHTFVFGASPQGFESLGENQLGDSTFSTPVICGGRIYHRVAHEIDGRRQEFLYCLGTK